jgi:acyl-CoA synthetase
MATSSTESARATTLLTRLSASDLASFHAAGHWRQETIYRLVQARSDATPDRCALRERTREVSYAALVEAADRLAGALHGRGVRPGQRVAVWLPSRAEIAVAVLACSRNGYVCCPSLHRDHTVADITELLGRMSAAAFIGQRRYGADADRADVFDAVAGIESLRLVLALDPPGANPALLPELPASAPLPPESNEPDTIVYLAFTSGTTGQPKGVMHSDNTLLAPVRSLMTDWALDETTVCYSMSPLSHNLGFGAMLLALTSGGQLVVHDLERGASVADRLRETAATFVFGVPTHALDLLDELSQRPGLELPAIRGFRVSGAPVPAAVAEGLLDHGITPQSGFGMTEAGSHHYTSRDEDPTRICETSGRACAAYELRAFALEDPDMESPVGEIGHLGGRGASLMLGYFDDQSTTEQSFNAQGWFMTGDIGSIDESGYLRVTGRTKDVIIRGGHKIFPTRIEGLAMSHDGVERAAVIAVPDVRLGERVCLAISVRSGCVVTPEQLLDHLDTGGLSKFDMPEYFLEVEQIPLLPSGKVAKRQLAARVRDGSLRPITVRFEGGS